MIFVIEDLGDQEENSQDEVIGVLNTVRKTAKAQSQKIFDRVKGFMGKKHLEIDERLSKLEEMNAKQMEMLQAIYNKK